MPRSKISVQVLLFGTYYLVTNTSKQWQKDLVIAKDSSIVELENYELEKYELEKNQLENQL